MTPGRTARLLPLAAIGGSILFDVAWMLMGHLRPGYSSVSRPISALAIGPDGVFVRAAFLLYGALVSRRGCPSHSDLQPPAKAAKEHPP